MALGSFTGMGFHLTVDFSEGNKMVFFSLWKLAFKENGIVVAKIDFKLSKNNKWS